jgi:hypothetical protein
MTTTQTQPTPAPKPDAQPVTAAHTPGAVRLAEILLPRGRPSTLATAYGRKTREGIAAMIDAETSAPALLNMLQRLVDECSETRVAPEGILASAPCLLTLEQARAALQMARGGAQ